MMRRIQNSHQHHTKGSSIETMVRSTRRSTFSLSVEINTHSLVGLSSWYNNAAHHLAMCFHAGVDHLARTWISDTVVYRWSIFLMVVEYMQDFLLDWSIAIDIKWLITVALSMSIFCFFLYFLVFWQSTENGTALAGLDALLLLEILVPATMIGGTTMCCLGVVTGETVAVLIPVAWVTSACSSDYVRRHVYQNLGHG